MINKEVEENTQQSIFNSINSVSNSFNSVVKEYRILNKESLTRKLKKILNIQHSILNTPLTL